MTVIGGYELVLCSDFREKQILTRPSRRVYDSVELPCPKPDTIFDTESVKIVDSDEFSN